MLFIERQTKDFFYFHILTSSWVSRKSPIVQQKLKSWKVLWQQSCNRMNVENHLSFSTGTNFNSASLVSGFIWIFARKKNSWIPDTKEKKLSKNCEIFEIRIEGLIPNLMRFLQDSWFRFWHVRETTEKNVKVGQILKVAGRFFVQYLNCICKWMTQTWGFLEQP